MSYRCSEFDLAVRFTQQPVRPPTSDAIAKAAVPMNVLHPSDIKRFAKDLPIKECLYGDASLLFNMKYHYAKSSCRIAAYLCN
jgi:hypothetical protein